MVCSEVSAARITSTSRMSGTGLKKCSPQTRSRWRQARAIAATGSDEVLVASTVAAGTMSSSAVNRRCLGSSCSMMASITICAGASSSQPHREREPPSASAAAWRGDLTLLREPRDPRVYFAACLAERRLARVVQDDLEPRHQRRLGDAGAHRARADDAYGVERLGRDAI